MGDADLGGRVDAKRATEAGGRDGMDGEREKRDEKEQGKSPGPSQTRESCSFAPFMPDLYTPYRHIPPGWGPSALGLVDAGPRHWLHFPGLLGWLVEIEAKGDSNLSLAIRRPGSLGRVLGTLVYKSSHAFFVWC